MNLVQNIYNMSCRSNGQRCPQLQRVPRENQDERRWQQLYGLGPEPEDHPHSCQERLCPTSTAR